LPAYKKNSDIDHSAVIEAAAESILITTSNLDYPGPSIVYVNPAFERMTGWSRRELFGKSPRIFQGPKTDLQVFSDLREKLSSNQIWEGQAINYRKDGSEFWMEWSIARLNDTQGRAYQYVAIQRDVSARIEADRRLYKALDAKRAAEQARANLARYFSPKLAEILAAKDQPLGAVRRQNMAILFADIVGFTRLSETLDPEQVIEILREWHSWVEAVIFKWDGSIEGYIGDSTLAIFGFPEIGEKDASNALACAYELLTAAQRWNQERAEKGKLPIRIGIGLNYGSVVLGDVGAKEYVEFTVIGDTVNIASRLQQATRLLHCDLVVSEKVVNAIKEENGGKNIRYLLERLKSHGIFNVRGRTQGVEISTLTIEPVEPRTLSE
jgi:PAS domain S-box-containing protein